MIKTEFMELYEELGALNDESNIPYRINKNFSAEQLDNYIQQHYGSEEPATGSIYIAPNGKFINSGADHANLVYSLETNNLLKKARNYKSFADEYGDVFVDGEVLAVLLGYVRCNTCIGDWAYISLPTKTITSAQARSIAEWLDKHIYTNQALRSVDVCTDNESHTYQLTDYTSDEIVRKIKRYYTSGRLYENN
jgi:hypothetical protein